MLHKYNYITLKKIIKIYTEDKMKIYTGKLSNEKVGGQKIIVKENDRQYLLPHIERHSPDGFNWGYGGSGPADTALSILADCVGIDQANQLYQTFKWDFVSGWGSEWSITEEEIREWIGKEEGPKENKERSKSWLLLRN